MRQRFLTTAGLLMGLAAPALAQEPPSTVSTIVASVTPWQDSFEAVGSLRAARGADLAPEIGGIVDSLGFESGQEVAAGAVLLRLRANDDPAKLAELQAASDLAEVTLARDRKQLHAQAVSQATIDADESRLRQARAQVAQQQALMDEKIIRAPFAGRLGLRQVDVGQYLSPGTTVVTLQALDPIYVDFYVPQRDLAQVTPGEAATLAVDAYPGRPFVARIEAVSPKLDTASRMAAVRALLPNPDHALYSGMFATVRLHTGPVRDYVTLPNTAVIYNPYGSAVYLVNKGEPATVRQVLVVTGPTRGDQVAVLSGVRPGDVVVTAGQIKLRQGAAVVVNNTVQPSNNPAPHPAEE